MFGPKDVVVGIGIGGEYPTGSVAVCPLLHLRLKTDQ
jgi:hypothetical protein